MNMHLMLHEITTRISFNAKYYGTTNDLQANIKQPCGLAADEVGKWAGK
jgi:hypothetical protein